ncbi:biotin-dependent carboxyltransferase family protein [Polaribacter porphyrae]|uniref:Allophanate hydrolase n=1 Tax=Polaribacter porphyrae TaxID=1137780 RepID=A0A2S7WSP0_9FLAO|nr:biotin-dependent carboxyltransferase family protein [Polaribacter porphyrae]PQJ80610.1 allophanate hydrolase [Polaribacter porphyrae]
MLKVLKSGFYTTIQDKGRVGFASKGIPISGAMDSYSADLANSILNNSLNDAVIEITLGACQFQFFEPVVIAISGGDFSPKVNNHRIQLNKRIYIEKNSILSFGKVNYGVRCYVAVKDGFQSEVKLKSRSFYPNITKDFIIRKNDEIPYKSFTNNLNTSKLSVKVNKNHFESEVLECYKGSEFDLLNSSQHQKITKQTFTISNDNNRMGYKLNEVVANDLNQILTSAVLAGTVQLTPSGKLIVLMRDCQVTGGYPRILQLTEASVNKLAQKTTNTSLQFSIVGI